MRRGKLILCAVVLAWVGSYAHGDRVHTGPEGYAGPGWAVLFGSDNTGGMQSLAPLAFRISENLYLGPEIAYDESASEGPGRFLGGLMLEGRVPLLSRGWYSTSVRCSLLTGASNLPTDPLFSGQVQAAVTGNIQLLPGLTFGAGPLAALRLESGTLQFLYGLTFFLRESTPLDTRSLIPVRAEGPRVTGYWQGMWIAVDERFVFVDGGGTRLQFANGLAFGITGGVLRQKIEREGKSLAIMLTGATIGWNYRPINWFSFGVRVTSGAALYGWAAPDGTMDGGPHFMVRPEGSVYFGVLPFLELGGGIGYHAVAGAAQTDIPLNGLSSVAFTIQARTGHRQ